jgi:phage terminase large subunit-like protein
MPCTPVTPGQGGVGKDKAMRAYGVQSYCQKKQVYLNLEDKTHVGLLDELLLFSGADKNPYPDDRVDAFVYALTKVREMTSRRRREAESHGPMIARPRGAIWRNRRRAG